MADDKKQPSLQTKRFKAVMRGIAAGAATFLFCRWALKLGFEPSWIAAGFVGFALGTFLYQRAGNENR